MKSYHYFCLPKTSYTWTNQLHFFPYSAAQTDLSQQLDSLSKRLKEIEELQGAIPDFNEKVKKLINVKHKVTVITNVLQASQVVLVLLKKSKFV